MRLDRDSEAQGVGRFRLQVHIARGRAGDQAVQVVVGLVVAGRHADAARQTGVGRSAPVAGVDDLQGDLAAALEQLQDRRGAEALRPGAAHQNVLNRTPAHADLHRRGVADRVVVRVAGRQAQIQALGHRQIAQQGRGDFQIGFVQAVLAGRRHASLRGGGGVGARQIFRGGVDVGIGRVGRLVLAILIARRHGQRARRQLIDVAGDVERQIIDLGAVRLARRVADEVRRLGRHRREQIDRHAARRRGAGRRIAQTQEQVLVVDAVQRRGLHLVAGVAAVGVPAEVASEQVQFAVEARAEAIGFHVLNVVAVAHIRHHLAHPPGLIGTEGQGVGGRHAVGGPERVEGVVRRQAEAADSP